MNNPNEHFSFFYLIVHVIQVHALHVAVLVLSNHATAGMRPSNCDARTPIQLPRWADHATNLVVNC